MNVTCSRGRWAAVVVVGAFVAMLGGCGGGSERPRLSLEAPAVVYVSLDADRAANSKNDLDVTQDLTGHGPTDVSVTFDVRDLAGVAELKTGGDDCRVGRAKKPVFGCTLRTDRQLNRAWETFHVVPAKGSEAGDSGVVRYTVRTPGVPAVTGRTTVVVGTPELEVVGRPDRSTVAPGGTVGVRVVVRNTGEVPARGVVLRMNAKDGFSFAGTHRNCRYYKGDSASCALPPSEAVIAPGEAYALDVPERLRASADAMYPGVSLSADAIEGDYVAPPKRGPDLTSGSGPDLRLVPVGGAAGLVGPDLQVAVTSRADLAAVGDTVKGPVGSKHTLRIGFRTHGPGSLRDTPVTVGFTVPAGTSVVEYPHSYSDGEEFNDVCRALRADGTPLTESPDDEQPPARRYTCTAPGGKAEQLTLFPFTLRIDQDLVERGGQVTVRGADAKRPSHDDRHGNDTAAVSVRIWSGPGWATESFYATAAVALALLLLAAAALRHPRLRGQREK